MNPFNLLINYVIANSRATFYNVPGNQEITNTALLTGIVSENPLMSYLIIDNKAKIEGDNFKASNVAKDVVTSPAAVLEPSKETAASTDTQTKTGEPDGTNQNSNIITLEAIKSEINTATGPISKDIQNLKSESVNKSDLEKLTIKIDSLDKERLELKESISRIEKKIDEISKSNQLQDTGLPTKSISNQKTQSKTETK